MKINYGVTSNVFKKKDFNVDTVYERFNEKFYKILDEETREKEEITEKQFNGLEPRERLVIYDEIEMTYKEHSKKLEEENVKLKTELEQQKSTNQINMMGIVDVNNRLRKLEAN